MKKKTNAVTFGRYVLITHAHLSTVMTILDEWQFLTIGVLDLSHQFSQKTNHEWQRFFDICDEKIQSPKSHVFNVEERYRMWEATIQHEQLAQRVQVVPMKRPECVPEEFNHTFPPEKYDLVFPQSQEEHNEFDLLRNQAFPSILKRPIHFVTPPLTLHTTEINQRILLGESWERFIAPGASAVFKEINGIQRMYPQW